MTPTWLSAQANVALPLELSGVPKAEAFARAGAALDRVGLAGAWAARPAQLSGGMAMRVSLARALATGPKLLLLDEPFAALDEITRRTLADDVLTLWSQSRPAIVFVTHSVEEAAYMAARVVVLTRGPGRIAGEIAIPGDLPRPAAFRATSGFRQAAEDISACLAKGSEAMKCKARGGSILDPVAPASMTSAAPRRIAATASTIDAPINSETPPPR